MTEIYSCALGASPESVQVLEEARQRRRWVQSFFGIFGVGEEITSIQGVFFTGKSSKYKTVNLG